MGKSPFYLLRPLTVLIYDNIYIYRYACRNCTIYEIYPESETPILTKITHLDLDPSQYLYVCLLPGTVIWHGIYNGRVVFRVWDYRQNHSISFSVDVKCKKFDLNLKVHLIILSKALKTGPLTYSFVGNGH